MSASLRGRVRRVERAVAQNRRQDVVVISGTDEESEAKIAAAYASGQAHPDQLLVYIRKRIWRGKTV